MKYNIQARFNNEAIDMLPRVKKEILKATQFEANQMKCLTLAKCCNASQHYRCAIAFMTKEELKEFEQDLLDVFKFKNWIN